MVRRKRPCTSSITFPVTYLRNLAGWHRRTYDASMSYKALLFCPEEKTARVVTQVLSELEFQVERCNEPFAAVKKLMAEHFDALVVDTDNEQNATLLFKSAHNSGLNQASLSVAVVEGQAGVAKAFRIGANLVLTKPINVEQSKGTLRVARGLLRKSDFTKTAFTPPAMGRTVSAGEPRPAQTVSPFPPISRLPQPPAPVIPIGISSALEVEQEPEPQPEPAEAALLESMPDPPGARSHEAITATANPWHQISQTIVEPVASAIRPTGPAGKAQPQTPAPFARQQPEAGRSVDRASAAAAAPAKAAPRGDESAFEAENQPPLFSSFAGLDEEPKAGSGRAQKILIAAVVLIAVAGAGYAGWSRMQSATVAPPNRPTTAAPSQPVSTPGAAANANQAPIAVLAPVEQAPDITLSTDEGASSGSSTDALASSPQASKPNPSKARTPAVTTSSPAKAAHAPAADDKEETQPEASAPEVVVVKNETPKEAPPTPLAEETAPPTLELGASHEDRAISGIVAAAPTSAPQAAPHTLKVSQGISQGLLIKKVPPAYPEAARRMRLEGAVELLATIGKDGSITNVKAISGDRVLARSAMDAVKQWKYKAYYLDGQAVEFQTQITVKFKLPNP